MHVSERGKLRQQDEQGRATPQSLDNSRSCRPILNVDEIHAVAANGNRQQLFTVDLNERLLAFRLDTREIAEAQEETV